MRLLSIKTLVRSISSEDSGIVASPATKITISPQAIAGIVVTLLVLVSFAIWFHNFTQVNMNTTDPTALDYLTTGAQMILAGTGTSQ